MVPEPIQATLLVVEALEALGVPYLIGGSLASAVHGVVRTTMDADLLADLQLEHAEPLTQMLGDAFYPGIWSMVVLHWKPRLVGGTIVQDIKLFARRGEENHVRF